MTFSGTHCQIWVSAKKSRKMPRMPPRPTHLMIRLALHGCVNRPFYHVVLLENRSNRDFFPKEQIGSYDPLPNIYNEKLIALNFERLRYWVACGAQCSKPVEKLLGLAGFFPVHPMSYTTAKRNNQKCEKLEEEEKAKAAAEEAGVESSLR